MQAYNSRTILFCLVLAVALITVEQQVEARPAITEKKHPVVIVPGFIGTQAFGKHKDQSDKKYIRLWSSLWGFVEPEKYTGYLQAIYDPFTKTIHNNTDRDVIFPGWGDTWSVDYLGDRRIPSLFYMHGLIEGLKEDPFFVPNISLRAAPFDFRQFPTQNTDYLSQLKLLIEETYSLNGNTPIVLLAHSFGCLYSLEFFAGQTNAWKGKYIKAFVSMGGPFGGTVEILKAEISGDNFGVNLHPSVKFRELQRSFPAAAALLADPRLWSKDEPIVVTPERNYSVHDYKQLFQDLNFTLGYQMYLDSAPTQDYFKGPKGVHEVHCVHCVGVPTIAQLRYSKPTLFHKGFPDGAPFEVRGEGDETVPLRSLEVCKKWSNIKYHTFPECGHRLMHNDRRIIDLVHQVAGSKPRKHE